VLSDRCELNNALAVLRAGADGYVFEQISRDALIKTLDLVMLGVTTLPAPLMRLIGEEHEMDSEDDSAVPATQTDVPTFDHMPRTLSQREMTILRCLMQGEPNKIIARQFDITEATVKVHIKTILRKISVRNRTQAAVWAQSHLHCSLTERLAPDSDGKLVAATDSFADASK
jgi:two-component system nitrate/nitrite response regulator NarL